MTMSIWIENTSLDPPNPKTKDKLAKLIGALIKEREHLLGQILKQAQSNAESWIGIVEQTGWVQGGSMSFWGSFGPAQGIDKTQISALSGQVYAIEQTLQSIYTLWPEFEPDKGKKTALKKKR